MLLGLNFAASLTSTALLSRNPELLAERSNVKAGKSWDKPLVGFMVLVGPVATWVTAGLDTRFHWSDAMPTSGFLAGLAVAVLSAALIAWAMHSNQFFSSVVRIQKDRGHVVVAGGPYRFVRHPGYTGMAAFTLATPLILNSRWALVPAVVTAAEPVSERPGRSHPAQRARRLRRLRAQGEIQALTAYLVSRTPRTPEFTRFP